jgi:hypothetical protein
MKHTGGRANPKRVGELLQQALDAPAAQPGAEKQTPG